MSGLKSIALSNLDTTRELSNSELASYPTTVVLVEDELIVNDKEKSTEYSSLFMSCNGMA
jgi:hypothetical protein